MTPNQLKLIDDKAFFSEFRDYDENYDPNLLQKRPTAGKRSYFSVSANFLSLSLLSKEDLNRKSSILFPYFFYLKKKREESYREELDRTFLFKRFLFLKDSASTYNKVDTDDFKVQDGHLPFEK